MSQQPNSSDVGAAMIAWYADALREHPQGLVTQAQAAAMLSVSRMAISRLVSRGYLRAAYFPKPPEIEGVAVGADDPTWIKIAGWLGGESAGYTFPKASYVSFEDVMSLWQSGEAAKKCRRDWNEIMASLLTNKPTSPREQEILAKYKEEAARERKERSIAKRRNK